MPPARDICGRHRIISIPMPKTEPVLRKARVQDLESIYAIEVSSFPDPYPKGLLKAFFFMPGAYLLAVEGDKAIGYAIGIIRHGTVGHIVSIAVLGEHQRQGVGMSLLERLGEDLAALGAEELRLEVRPSNDKAIRLYSAAGFKEQEIIKKYYADGESALVMRLILNQRPQK